MNVILSSFNSLTSGTLPVFRIISLIIAIIFLIVGFSLKHKNKKGGKETAGWICIGIGVVSIISNVLQLLA